MWVMSMCLIFLVCLKEQIWDFSSFAQACSEWSDHIGILSGYKSHSSFLELSNEGGRSWLNDPGWDCPWVKSFTGRGILSLTRLATL